jgi:hypothetical protein
VIEAIVHRIQGAGSMSNPQWSDSNCKKEEGNQQETSKTVGKVSNHVDIIMTNVYLQPIKISSNMPEDNAAPEKNKFKTGLQIIQ